MHRAEARVTVRNAATEISKREFCDTFGISESHIERLFQQGMPHAKQSSRKITIPMPAGRVWYHDFLVEKGKKQAAPKDLDDAKLRKAAAEAEMAELELAKVRGDTMLVDDHERMLGEAFGRARAKLLNLGPRAAGAAFGAATLQECQAKIEPIVVEIMDELCRADDVPDVTTDDEPEESED